MDIVIGFCYVIGRFVFFFCSFCYFMFGVVCVGFG